jgi:heme oxygenase
MGGSLGFLVVKLYAVSGVQKEKNLNFAYRGTYERLSVAAHVAGQLIRPTEGRFKMARLRA